MGGPLWYIVTYIILLGVYLSAVYVPSIWVALELIGASAVTLISFLFPMGLLLRVEGRKLPRTRRALAYLVIVLGALVAVVGTWGVVRDIIAQMGGGNAPGASSDHPGGTSPIPNKVNTNNYNNKNIYLVHESLIAKGQSSSHDERSDLVVRRFLITWIMNRDLALEGTHD